MRITINLGSGREPTLEVEGYAYHREQVGQLIEVLDALAHQLPMENEPNDTPAPISLREAS